MFELRVLNGLRQGAALPLFERQRSLGMEIETLDAAALHALEPALGARAVAGALYPTGCHVSDPLDFTRALGEAAIARGAQERKFEAVAVTPVAFKCCKTCFGCLKFKVFTCSEIYKISKKSFLFLATL